MIVVIVRHHGDDNDDDDGYDNAAKRSHRITSYGIVPGKASLIMLLM
jgi:hypothetical protein